MVTPNTLRRLSADLESCLKGIVGQTKIACPLAVLSSRSRYCPRTSPLTHCFVCCVAVTCYLEARVGLKPLIPPHSNACSAPQGRRGMFYIWLMAKWQSDLLGAYGDCLTSVLSPSYIVVVLFSSLRQPKDGCLGFYRRLSGPIEGQSAQRVERIEVEPRGRGSMGELELNQAIRVVRKRGLGGRAPEDGFSLLELLIVIALIGIMGGAAVVTFTRVLPQRRADSAFDFLRTQLLQARQNAIDQRRNYLATFQGASNNELLIQRLNLDASRTTVADYFLPYGAAYTYFSTLPDTPDGFGNSSASGINFTSGYTGKTMIFVSDGTMTDGNSAFTNFTVFIGIEANPVTARAVTVMGATGRIRGYRYNGTAFQ